MGVMMEFKVGPILLKPLPGKGYVDAHREGDAVFLEPLGNE